MRYVELWEEPFKLYYNKNENQGLKRIEKTVQNIKTAAENIILKVKPKHC
jgi:hypothetical protein